MIIDFLIIAVIWVVVLDLTDFMDYIKGCISAILTKGKSHNSDYRLKPIDCSLCMTWWTCLIYMLCTGWFSLVNLMLALVIAYCTPIIKDLITTVFDAIEAIIKRLNKLI